MQAIFREAEILGEGHDTALLEASQLRVERQAVEDEPGADFDERETITNYAEHGVVTLFHFA